MNAQCDMILKFPLYVDQKRAYNLTPAVKSSKKSWEPIFCFRTN